MARSSSVLSLSSVLMVVVALGIGGVTGHVLRQDEVDRLKAEVQTLETEGAGLAQTAEDLRQQLSASQGQIAELEKQLDSTYAAVEVGGVVDFPVLRGMARKGDTLATFAQRESVDIAVLRALNPWLEGDDMALRDRQALWIPKKDR